MRSKVVEAQQLPEAGDQGAFSNELREGRPLARSMKFMGNAPPVVCISARETDHAQLANQLRVKNAKAGLSSLALTQVLTKWNALNAKKAIVALSQQSRKKEKRPRQNQYSSKRVSVIKNINKMVKTVQVKQSRKRTEDYRHAGSDFIKWLNHQRPGQNPDAMSGEERDAFRRAQHTRHGLRF